MSRLFPWPLAFFFSLLATSCGGGTQPSFSGSAAPEFRIAPGEASRWVDRRMELFKRLVLSPARSAGDPLPGYDRWLSAVASAIESSETAPEATSRLVVHAERELDTYRPPLPETKDLERLAAIKQYTGLATLGPLLIQPFKGQPAETRSAAAAYLWNAYRSAAAPKP